MHHIKRLILAGALFLAPLGIPQAVRAQQTAIVVATCGSASYTAGKTNYVTMDVNGNQCGNSSGGGGGGTNSTIVSGQAILSVTGTAQQFQSASATLTNGLLFCASPKNNSAGITVGGSGVTNTVSGSGNGQILLPGQCSSLAISNANLLYFNGTANDFISYLGN